MEHWAKRLFVRFEKMVYRGFRVLREGYGGESTGWLDL